MKTAVFVTDDPNTVTRTYSCSNLHHWRAATVRGETTIESHRGYSLMAKILTSQQRPAHRDGRLPMIGLATLTD